ncbi:MAG: hypothetical protein JSW66_08345 [Phycisphaerales bacterium]|nr:MAG: hypothetical protein JSW66_08345 [Phycisphaerales bacterium]
MRRGISTKRTGRVTTTYILGLALVMVGLGGSTAFALDPMGPPASALRQGDYKLTLDYSFSEMDFELTDGTSSTGGELIPLTLKDFQAHRAYAGLGYGLYDNWEAFVRFGGTKGTFGDSIWEVGEEFEGGFDFAVGAGAKATFYETDSWRVGALLQASYAEFDGTLELSAPGWLPDVTEIDILQVQAAIGATYHWTDRISVYAGPFAYMVMGDFEDTFPVTTNGAGTITLSWDIDDGPNYGGYLGAYIILNDNSMLNVEYQLAADASAVGLGLMWRI